MKKVFISFLFITFFLLVGCKREESFNCTIDIYNDIEEYKLIAEYKIYYKNSFVTKIEKKEVYESENEKTLNYFNEYKNLEYENLNNLYGEITYNVDLREDKVILNSIMDMQLIDLKKMVKDKYIDRDYVIGGKLSTGGIKNIYEGKGATCDEY